MNYECKIKQIEQIAEHTYKVLLQPELPIDFQAGQYLMVVMGEDDKRPFSIASCPNREGGEIELHIGAAEENQYASQVVEKIQACFEGGDSLTVDAPHGKAWFQKESKRPILLIAGGTGFSYARCILDYCLNQKVNVPIHLYWGAKGSDQLYAMQEIFDLTTVHNNLRFVPVIENKNESWQGHIGNVIEAVNSDFGSLADFDIYIAGRFEMAGAAREQFIINKQVNLNNIFSDAFAYM